ncbi:unnamed protein product, partial [Dicrocoelium dendriticum]
MVMRITFSASEEHLLVSVIGLVIFALRFVLPKYRIIDLPGKLSSPLCVVVWCGLRKHVSELHLTYQTHPCEYCGKSFSKKNTLKRHVKAVHLRQRNHICEYCAKSFFNAAHLRIHIDAVHL